MTDVDITVPAGPSTEEEVPDVESGAMSEAPSPDNLGEEKQPAANVTAEKEINVNVEEEIAPMVDHTAQSEPSNLAGLEPYALAAATTSSLEGSQKDEDQKKKAGAIPMVNPRGKVARKEAQMQGTTLVSSSPTPDSTSQAAARATNNSPTPSHQQTWSEKEEARQMKSAVPRPTKEEEVVPGFIAVAVPAVEGQIPVESNTDTQESNKSISVEDQNSNDEMQERYGPIPTPNQSLTHPPTPDSGLIEATLVDPVFAEANIIDGTGQPEDPAVRKRRFRICVGVNLLLGMTGLVLLLYFLLRKDEDKTLAPTTMAQTFFPSPDPTSANPYNLPEDTWQIILEDPTSPQGQAHEWLIEDMEDDNSVYEPWRIHQRFALALLFFATNGTDWNRRDNWLESNRECEWYSYSTTVDPSNSPCHTENDQDDGKVQIRQYVSLHLENNGLNGSVPPEVFQLLPALKSIDLNKNKGLTGSLTSQVGNLSRLEHFDIDRAAFFGSLPTELGLLTALTKLRLGVNRFDGRLPSQFGSLTQLQVLQIHENQFTGVIPDQIGNMKALQDLRMSSNRLTGPLPSTIKGLAELQFLVVEQNNLTGTISAELGQLTLLKVLKLKNNGFNGTIPARLGQMSALKLISVQRNRLTGTIPPALGQLAHLDRLLLHETDLTGSIPKFLFPRESKLERLILYGTKLTGTIPSQLGRLKSLEECWLHSNYLNGTLPSTMGLLTSLTSLSVNDTLLSGPLPSELENLNGLEFFNLSDTGLSGAVPGKLCNQAELIFDCSNTLCGCDCPCPPTQSPTTQSNNGITSTGSSPPSAAPTNDTIPDSTFSAQTTWTTPGTITFTVNSPEPNSTV